MLSDREGCFSLPHTVQADAQDAELATECAGTRATSLPHSRHHGNICWKNWSRPRQVSNRWTTFMFWSRGMLSTHSAGRRAGCRVCNGVQRSCWRGREPHCLLPEGIPYVSVGERLPHPRCLSTRRTSAVAVSRVQRMVPWAMRAGAAPLLPLAVPWYRNFCRSTLTVLKSAAAAPH